MKQFEEKDMADDIDLANDLMFSEVSRALSKRQQTTNQPVVASKHCAECGESIPKERQKLGFQLCVPCAAEEERRKSLYADNHF